MSRPFLWVLAILALAGVVVDGYAIHDRQRVDQRFANEVVLGRAEAERIRAQVI